MGKNFSKRKELAVKIACLTTHYPLEPMPQHTHKLIFVAILAPFCHFLIKSRTWWYVGAYVYAPLQLYYSIMPT